MIRTGNPLVATFAIVPALVVSAFTGCGSKATDTLSEATDTDASTDDSGSTFGSDDGTGSNSGGGSLAPGGSFVPSGDAGVACPDGETGLGCYVNKSCPNGKQTTITGKVYDPAGKNPLYNVAVFVPNDPSTLPKISRGTNSCNTCDTPIGDYVAIALTDKTGSFTLKDVPTGKNVPLTVQIGKWRRTITVSTVADCATTTLPTSGAGQARLPRNKSEGDLPQMALVTGGFDDLGCFMRRMGVDASEYSAPGAGGRLDIFQGQSLTLVAPTLSSGTAGNCTTANCPLWDTKAHLENYDLVLLACEGSTFDNAKPASAKQAMHDWLNEGGKVFATHFHYTWFQNSPAADFQGIATWLGPSIGFSNVSGKIDTSFPKGQTFDDWLGAVGALTGGTVGMTGVATSVSSVSADASRWIYDSAPGADGGAGDTKYFSFGTPIGGLQVTDAGPEVNGKQYCGKAVFSDLHAGGSPKGDVPAACDTSDLSAQEKALEFLFFDLAACVTDDTKPPPVPPEPPK